VAVDGHVPYQSLLKVFLAERLARISEVVLALATEKGTGWLTCGS
jgi:hypothetical protein